MKTQDELFEDIKTLARKVDNLKGWVQNDFHRMAADGHLTKKDLLDSIEDMLDDFDEKGQALNLLKLEVWAIMTNAAKELK